MRHFRGLFLVTAALLVLAAPATGWAFTLGGKDKIAELQAEADRLRSELARQQAELATRAAESQNLKAENEQLKKKISSFEQEVAQLQSKGLECEKKLAVEAKRGTGIKVIFFSGDIIYEVASGAFVDYKAGMRYRSLSDSSFNEKLRTFEEGKGGDFEVLSIMKLVDTINDRLIDEAEALAFRQKEEGHFAQVKSK